MEREPRQGEFIARDEQPQASRWSAQRARVIRLPIAGTLGFGSMLAITISYFHNQSIAWAVVHGLFSWFFVIYAALFYD